MINESFKLLAGKLLLQKWKWRRGMNRGELAETKTKNNKKREKNLQGDVRDSGR